LSTSFFKGSLNKPGLDGHLFQEVTMAKVSNDGAAKACLYVSKKSEGRQQGNIRHSFVLA
jgi:hypothetical protein